MGSTWFTNTSAQRARVGVRDTLDESSVLPLDGSSAASESGVSGILWLNPCMGDDIG